MSDSYLFKVSRVDINATNNFVSAFFTYYFSRTFFSLFKYFDNYLFPGPTKPQMISDWFRGETG